MHAEIYSAERYDSAPQNSHSQTQSHWVLEKKLQNRYSDLKYLDELKYLLHYVLQLGAFIFKSYGKTENGLQWSYG